MNERTETIKRETRQFIVVENKNLKFRELCHISVFHNGVVVEIKLFDNVTAICAELIGLNIETWRA